jgi:hypothetical protein
MHPTHSLFYGGEVIHTVGLFQGLGDTGSWGAGLPLASLLCEGNAVATLVISNSNQNGFTLARDKNVGLVMNRYTITGENGDSVVIGEPTYTEQRRGELVKGVGSCSSRGKVRERQSSNVLCSTGRAIGNTDTFGGGP